MAATVKCDTVVNAASSTDNLSLDTSGNVTVGSNLTFSGASARFLGDFSNATVTTRLSFQTSTTNGSTGIYALPNGSSTAASWQATNNATATNCSKILIATNGSTDVQLVSGINGSGTYLPLSFYTSGAQKMQLDISGNLNIGTSGVSAKLYVSGNAAQNISALGSSTGTVTLDLSTANNFSMTLTGNVTLANPSNITAGQSGVIFITNGSSSAYTMSFGTYWDFPNQSAPSLTATTNAVDVLVWTARTTTSIAVQILPNIGP